MQERRDILCVGGRDRIGSVVLTPRYISVHTCVHTSSISIIRLISHGMAEHGTARHATRTRSASDTKSAGRATLTKCLRRENEVAVKRETSFRREKY